MCLTKCFYLFYDSFFFLFYNKLRSSFMETNKKLLMDIKYLEKYEYHNNSGLWHIKSLKKLMRLISELLFKLLESHPSTKCYKKYTFFVHCSVPWLESCATLIQVLLYSLFQSPLMLVDAQRFTSMDTSTVVTKLFLESFDLYFRFMCTIPKLTPTSSESRMMLLLTSQSRTLFLSLKVKLTQPWAKI